MSGLRPPAPRQSAPRCGLLLPLLGLPLLAACDRVAPVLPELSLPAGVLLQREWIPLGIERSLGRAERLDQDGCWRQATNTWLWVQDPALQGATASGLFRNGSFDAEPWFCLSQSQTWRLRQALSRLPRAGRLALPADTPLVLRYSARVQGELRLAVVPLGQEAQDPATAELQALLGSFASEGAWGRSPEDGGRSPEDGGRSPEDGGRSPEDGGRSPGDISAEKAENRPAPASAAQARRRSTRRRHR